MPAASFFEAFADFVRPDFNRPKAEGDFYGSPLRYLGIDAQTAYQVAPQLMKTTNTDNKPVFTNLEEINRQSGRRIYIDFGQYQTAILLSEATLQVYPQRNCRLDDFNFFVGLLDLFGGIGYEHKADEKLYQAMVDGWLAILWLAYKRCGLQLPTNGQLPPGLFNLLIDDAPNDSANAELAACYDNCFQLGYKLWRGLLESKADAYIGKNDDKKGDNSAASTNYAKKVKAHVRHPFRAKANDLSFWGKTFHLQFLQSPWNQFFHRARERNQADFARPGKPFPFYQKHPSPLLFWETMMLAALHQRLHDHVQAEAQGNWFALFAEEPFTMSTDSTPPDSPQDVLGPLTTRDPNAEPLIAKQTQQQIKNKRNGGNRRFYNPHHAASPAADAALSAPLFLTRRDRDLCIETDAERRLLPACSVRLPKAELERVCGEYWLLYIDVFVYRGDARIRIPSEVVDETEETEHGQSYVKFALQMEQWALDALNLSLPPDGFPPLAGFSGKELEGHIAIVIVES